MTVIVSCKRQDLCGGQDPAALCVKRNQSVPGKLHQTCPFQSSNRFPPALYHIHYTIFRLAYIFERGIYVNSTENISILHKNITSNLIHIFKLRTWENFGDVSGFRIKNANPAQAFEGDVSVAEEAHFPKVLTQERIIVALDRVINHLPHRVLLPPSETIVARRIEPV